MDCCICSSYPSVIRPPRNTICGACYEGIKAALSFIDSFEGRDQNDVDHGDHVHDKGETRLSSRSHYHKPLVSSPSKGLAAVHEWMKRRKNAEDDLTQKLTFLAGSDLAAFRQRLHTDIEIKSRDGPSIFAHRAMLASRSPIFKNMLDSDSCKSASNGTVTIPELTYGELKSLIEFIYSGNLPPETMEKHVYALMLASDKYSISYLHEFCEQHMLGSLNVGNALDILEVSDVCSNQKLKDTVLSFVVKNINDIAFSSKYEKFCMDNPCLGLQIMRASLIDAKNNSKEK